MKYFKTIIGFAVDAMLSWLFTVGFVKLITICFRWEFSLPVITGTWAIVTLIRWFVDFKENNR